MGLTSASVAVLVACVLFAPAPPVVAETCDPHVPETCSLRELGGKIDRRIGSTLEPHQVLESDYLDTLVDEFSSMTPENALKWYTVRPAPDTWNFGHADAVVDAAEAHGLEVRGHTLVWAQDPFTPDWVEAETDPVALRALVDEQITTVMGRYRDRVHRWDVVNEPLATLGTGPSDSVFWEVLGPGWVADAFRTAHAVDPTAELWLNEVGTDYRPAKHEALLALVRGLVDDGVPIHGVGIQAHRFTPVGPDAAVLERQLRDFTDLGLSVAITELDVATDPADPSAAERQADAYERVVGACLAVARCVEVTTWGLTDRSTWLDSFAFLPRPTRPLLFDEEMRPKPAYDRVRSLLAEAVLQLPPTLPTTTTSTPSSSTASSTEPLPPRGASGAGTAAPARAVTAVPHFAG
jgi:endo-1,4-beta-xylanase